MVRCFLVFNSFVCCFPFIFVSFYVIPSRFLTLLTSPFMCFLLNVQFCKFKAYQNSGSIKDDRYLEWLSDCHFLRNLCCCLQTDALTWVVWCSITLGEYCGFVVLKAVVLNVKALY